MAQIKKAVRKTKPRAKVKPKAKPRTRKNPSRASALASLTKDFTDFHGAHPQKIARMDVPKPGPGWLLGKVAYVAYFAERDGEYNLYHHDFKAKSAPCLVINKDGKILLGGGRYKVGDRGIVDRG